MRFRRGNYASLTCPCGHSRVLCVRPDDGAPADVPADALDEGGLTIRPDVLARMRCDVCGRRGPGVIYGWSGGG